MIANLPGSVGALPAGVAGAREPAAAHVRGQREPAGSRQRPASTSSSPTRTRCPRPGAVATLARLRRRPPARRPRRPARALAGRDVAAVACAASRPCSGTIWRRTPLRLAPSSLRAPGLPLRHAAPTEPVQGDWLLGGACLLMRRDDARASSAAGTAASATTSRTSTSPTAPRRPAGSAGSSPRRSSTTTYAAVIDKRFFSPAHALAPARDGAASCASTPSACAPSRRLSSSARRGPR